MAMIKVNQVFKRYGKLQALNGMNLLANQGDIYGFIGPNGAGKSTTFKILATILKPDSGHVAIDKTSITEGAKIRKLIGYMPDSFGVYDDMSVYHYLDFFAAAYYIPWKKRKSLIGDVLALTDLEFKRDAMCQSLSRGMQQRLGVARVLIHDPKVLILDEPASGLDPRARIEFRELLKELSNMGKTIIISSHILAELSEICTRVGIVEKGKMIFEGSRNELNDKLGAGKVLVETDSEKLDLLKESIQQAGFIDKISLQDRTLVLTLNDPEMDVSIVSNWLFQNNFPVHKFAQESLSLEQAFMNITKGELA